MNDMEDNRCGSTTIRGTITLLGLWCVPTSFLLLLSGTGVADSAHPADSSLATVDRFVAAFNAKQPNEMLSLCNGDFRWISVDEAGMTVTVEGKEALRASLLEMFESDTRTRSVLLEKFESRSWVTTLERATWTAGGEQKSQCSVAIYALRDNRISAVWYFPSHDCPDHAP